MRSIFSDIKMEVVLASHSGGGSFIFGYLNAVAKIPDDVKRIAFLDSDYGYDPELATRTNYTKLARRFRRKSLVRAGVSRRSALLNGKPFVSATGGTWGRSHAMLGDLARNLSSPAGRMADSKLIPRSTGGSNFCSRKIPDQKIFHTVQVERNGFIQAMVSGTTAGGKSWLRIFRGACLCQPDFRRVTNAHQVASNTLRCCRAQDAELVRPLVNPARRLIIAKLARRLFAFAIRIHLAVAGKNSSAQSRNCVSTPSSNFSNSARGNASVELCASSRRCFGDN